MLAIITTCKPRLSVAADLLKDIHQSDWDYPVIITTDYEAVEMKGLTSSIPDHRSNDNFKLAVKRGISAKVPWFLLLEDDSEININIKHNLLNWEPLLNASLGCGGLSTNGKNRHSYGEGKNWYTPDSNLVYGMQGAILTRDFAISLLDNWEFMQSNFDLKLARYAGKNIVGRYFKYWPSLVRHRHEEQSVCNHGIILTEGFDKEFKSA